RRRVGLTLRPLPALVVVAELDQDEVGPLGQGPGPVALVAVAPRRPAALRPVHATRPGGQPRLEPRAPAALVGDGRVARQADAHAVLLLRPRLRRLPRASWGG